MGYMGVVVLVLVREWGYHLFFNKLLTFSKANLKGKFRALMFQLFAITYA